MFKGEKFAVFEMSKEKVYSFSGSKLSICGKVCKNSGISLSGNMKTRSVCIVVTRRAITTITLWPLVTRVMVEDGWHSIFFKNRQNWDNALQSENKKKCVTSQ